MSAISDQTRPDQPTFPSLPVKNSYFLGVCVLGWIFWVQCEGNTSKFLTPQPAMDFNSFATSLSSFELFSNLKWVLFPCYYCLWVRYPNPLWGRLYSAILDIPKWLELWTLITLARSAIWFQNQNDQQNSLLQC